VKLRSGKTGSPIWLRSPLSSRRKWPAIDASPPCTAGSWSARRSISARISQDPPVPRIKVSAMPSGLTPPVASGITRA
jgi:hypothetical protein